MGEGLRLTQFSTTAAARCPQLMGIGDFYPPTHQPTHQPTHPPTHAALSSQHHVLPASAQVHIHVLTHRHTLLVYNECSNLPSFPAPPSRRSARQGGAARLPRNAAGAHARHSVVTAYNPLTQVHS
jgi:hypothetical protein